MGAALTKSCQFKIKDMTHYIITGTSSGIGLALAQKVLEKKDVFVSGISRNPGPDHERYKHYSLDLNRVEDVAAFELPQVEADEVILINNAGYLGDIKRIGTADPKAIARVFNVNVTAVALLMNKFLTADYAAETEKTVLNVSSGAGSYEIPAWASYCASKAAVDMLSKTAKVEQTELGNKVRILSVGPGVVDTPMQAEIRGAQKTDFSRVEDFKGFKEKGELASPASIAAKYLHVLQQDLFTNQVTGSLRDVEL